MKKDYLIVKRDIIISGIKVLDEGAYVKHDIVHACPVLNFDDPCYFETQEIDILDPGIRVTYNNQKCYVISTVETMYTDSYGCRRFRPFKVKDGVVEVRYKVAKSTTDKEKDQITVESSRLKSSESYWFINSSGDVCQAYKGDNTRADSWRKMHRNYWVNKEDAQDEREKLNKICC